MRQMILALMVAAAGGFALASCGSSSNNNADMGKDMAGGGAGPDMSIAKTNCTQFGTCIYTCVSSQQGDINTCQTMCAKNAKPGSATKWITAVICGQNYCTGDADMMTGKCVSLPDDPAKTAPTDPHTLCDPGITIAQCTASTYMSTKCSPCLSNARNYWFIDESVDPANPGPPTFMCAMPSSADCTAAKTTCMTSFNACLNDM